MGQSQDAYIYYGFNVGEEDDEGSPDWWDGFSWGKNKGVSDGVEEGYAGSIDYAVPFLYVKELYLNAYWGSVPIPDDFSFEVSELQESLINLAREECIKRNGSEEGIGEIGWFLAASYG